MSNLICEIVGTFPCLRCGRESLGNIQTKLFWTKSGRTITADTKDELLVTGLDYYVPLGEPASGDRLAVVVGDWKCRHCSQIFQWAKLTLRRLRAAGYPPDAFDAVVEGLDPFPAVRPEDFDGVDYIDDELAEFSGFPDTPPLERLAAFEAPRGREEKVGRVVRGYRRWLREQAGVPRFG